MNEQLQQAFLSILADVTQGTKNAITFLSGEIPDIIQQLLVWKATEYGALTLISFIFLFFFTRTTVKQLKADPNLDEFETFLLLTAGLLLAIAAIIVFFANLFPFLQVLIAPKIFLIEFAAELIKK